MKKVILSAIALATVVLSANAAAGANLNGTVGGTLLKQITISTTSNTATLPAGSYSGGALQFGKIGLPGVASTVTVSATGARSATAGAGLSNIDVTPTAASFFVNGGVNMGYTITLGAVTLTSAQNGCTVTDLTTTGDVLSRKTDGTTGDDAFAVGGTLNIPADATAGAVTGSFNVAVNYN